MVGCSRGCLGYLGILFGSWFFLVDGGFCLVVVCVFCC